VHSGSDTNLSTLHAGLQYSNILPVLENNKQINI
jgi:hypothetical protein